MPIDWDEAFKYSTPKVVQIRDRRLGGLYYFFTLGIALYVIGYTMIYNQKYNIVEAPDGFARLQLLAPSPKLCRDQEKLPYCAGSSANGSTVHPQHKPNGLIINEGNYTYPCQFRDSYFAVYPQVRSVPL